MEKEILKTFLEKASSSSCENIINLDLNNCVDINKYVILLPKLINLKCLILSNNNINQLPPFEKLLSLEELYLRNFNVSNKTSSTDSDLTKSFITKIRILSKLKHLVIIGTKFDTNSSKDYIIHYMTGLETLNFERITGEKRQDVDNRIKTIRERQQLNNKSPTSSPTSAKIITTPNKTVNRQQDISKKLTNTTSSIINISKSQNQVQYSPSNPISQTKQKDLIVTTTSPQKLNKVDFKLPPQILNNNSPKHKPKIPDQNESSPLPIEIIPNVTGKVSDKSNLIQAISLLIGSITTLNDIDFIQDVLYERKKILELKQ
ncbi:hypothetical protein ACTA71_002421 [Dictyostelium dimigraforme]